MIATLSGSRVQTRRTIWALVAAGALIIGLSGCSGARDDLHHRAVESLASHRGSTAELDFTRVEPGAWTRMIVGCGAQTRTSIERTLGFRWDSNDFWSKGSELYWAAPQGAFVIFSDGANVLDYYLQGQDPWVEQNYRFTPCPTASPFAHEIFAISRPAATAIRVDRLAGTSSDSSIWYISAEELDRLEAGSE